MRPVKKTPAPRVMWGVRVWSSTRGARVDEIERVYRTRFDDYVRVAAAIAGDPDAARDAVQDAFASAVRNRTAFRGDGPLEAWLWRTVVNAARNQRRRRPDPAPQPLHANGHDRDEASEVRVALALLPERQRLALFLRYFADLDYASIASVLGVTEGTVAATLHAAHRALRRRYEEVRS
jgi:RNA polymerase sigma-70 factor (ECF subfamily)